MALRLTAVDEMAQAVLGCVCAALDEAAADIADYPGCPCRACVVPGVPAWDGCADPCTGETGGQLTVHVARLYPSTDFPTQSIDVQGMRNCLPAPVTAAELVVTLLRCAPMPDARGCPPSCDAQATAARVLHVDAAVVMNALYCCLPGLTPGRRGPRFVVGAQRTVGPEGGCVGVEQRVTIALPGCKCPEEGAGP